MRYFGGKARIGKQIAEFLNDNLNENQTYWEPFIGGAWIMHRINPDANRIGSDLCMPLIQMYQQYQNGWEPPKEVSEELYQIAKKGEVEPELQAFIGFGCSFAGKWFGGYARDKNRNFALNAYNSLNKKMNSMKNVTFIQGSYNKIDAPKNAIIYCDPPYTGTTGYDAVGKFEFTLFWEWVRMQSKYNKVFISEYQAPNDFKTVLEINTKTDVRGKNGKIDRIEKLFTLK
jgi:DNA adenine methylase